MSHRDTITHHSWLPRRRRSRSRGISWTLGYPCLQQEQACLLGTLRNPQPAWQAVLATARIHLVHKQQLISLRPQPLAQLTSMRLQTAQRAARPPLRPASAMRSRRLRACKRRSLARVMLLSS